MCLQADTILAASQTAIIPLLAVWLTADCGLASSSGPVVRPGVADRDCEHQCFCGYCEQFRCKCYSYCFGEMCSHINMKLVPKIITWNSVTFHFDNNILRLISGNKTDFRTFIRSSYPHRHYHKPSAVAELTGTTLTIRGLLPDGYTYCVCAVPSGQAPSPNAKKDTCVEFRTQFHISGPYTRAAVVLGVFVTLVWCAVIMLRCT